MCKSFDPSRVERQQVLTDRLIDRTGLRAIMENVELRILVFGPVRFALELNLPDERRDRLNGIRHRKETDRRQASIRESRVHTLTDAQTCGLPGNAERVAIA